MSRASYTRIKDFLLLLATTVLAVLVQGYHPGIEDDAYYLAAIQKDLDPGLFPHDADFFQLQFQATIFDKLIAWSVRLTHLPLAWAVFLWHCAAIFLILLLCRKIAAKCFAEPHAGWAAVALVAALLTIPVSGTGLSLVDQYLHPRALATAAILAAIAAVMERRTTVAAAWLAAAAALHILMAAFGAMLCVFLGWNHVVRKRHVEAPRHATAAALLLPMGWIFDPASDAWRQAAATRTFYFVWRWHWYEWLGVVAPLLLLWWFHRIARRDGSAAMARLASRLAWFGLFQTIGGVAILTPPSLERLRPLEPMRYLHLIYLLMFLLAGGLIGKYVLGKHAYRWALFFLPLCVGMGYAQRQMYPATEHLELPGTAPRNAWVRTFRWIRLNTPPQSLFALDPDYMELPGEDFHGFRPLALRSVLADNVKDPGMVARVPHLADRWLAETRAQNNWKNFRAADFARLRKQFGVEWVVLDGADVAGLDCPYRDNQLSVCRVGR